jgi:hypothetical protein
MNFNGGKRGKGYKKKKKKVKRVLKQVMNTFQHPLPSGRGGGGTPLYF